MKQAIYIFQGILVAAFLWWLSSRVAWDALLEQSMKVPLDVLLLVFVQRYAPYMVLGMRLSVLIPSVSMGQGFKASVLCVACNTLIPARMGELLKIFWLQGISTLKASFILSSIVVERLLDVSALLCLSLYFALSHLSSVVIVLLSIVVVTAWVSLWFVITYESRVVAWMRRYMGQHGWAQRVIALCSLLCHAIRQVLQARVLCKSVLLTIFMWSMNYLHVYLLCNVLMELHLTWAQTGLICVALFFSSALLLAPGGVGAMETALVVSLELMGVNTMQAMSTALFARIFYSVPPLLGALGILFVDNKGLTASVRNLYGGVQYMYPTVRNKH